MCGIAGTVCLEDGCALDHEADVSRMCELIHHRGPDDGHVIGLHGACLGARRLAILDLSSAGRIPMQGPSGRWSIAYNGEIYNFASLRTELELGGHAFRSHSDTEVLLHAWMEWGESCVDRLVGMFAFAIHDADAGAVTLVRDRYGIKPLYYAERDGHVWFASETKAITRLHDGTLDAGSLLEWSLYRNVDALTPPTLFEGVRSVLPGQRVRIEGGRVEAKRLHSLPESVSRETFERYAKDSRSDVLAELSDTLQESVRARLISDVPVGTLLSGGLDSSLITAIAARQHGRFKAFHVALPGQGKLDESRHAERVAGLLGIELVTHSLSGTGFRRALTRAVYHSDMPLTHPNTVAYDLITRVAREHGVVVLLSGEGADELFGGYSWSYRRRRTLLRLRPVLDALPARFRGILALLSYSMAGLPTSSWRFRELLPKTVDLIDRYARRSWLERCQAAYDFVPRENDRAILGAMLADLGDFLAPLLRRLDRMSMANSVECRVPFLDHRMVHLATHLPLSYRVGARADKWVLKKVAADWLPSDIVGWKKAGFPLPTREFIAPLLSPDLFRNGFLTRELGIPWTGVARQLERGLRGEQDAFDALTLELWGRLFIRGESVGELEARVEELEP